jgi:hypothetical protein
MAPADEVNKETQQRMHATNHVFPELSELDIFVVILRCREVKQKYNDEKIFTGMAYADSKLAG